MFALSLWDHATQQLHLARDRFGEKPLYYGWAGTNFFFASELKAISVVPDFARVIDRDALAMFMRFLMIPAPHSIFRGIYKLEPGCLLTLNGAAPEQPPRAAPVAGMNHETMTIRRWWSVAEQFAAGLSEPFQEEDEALRILQIKLEKAVAIQARADVPLGVFLSGGVDSSLIAALIQKHSSQRIRSFTLGSEDRAYDERAHARAVAEHLGTDHSELLVTDADAQAVIPMLATIYDEPFADPSQIPTHLISRAARQHVTVALSGDGGDELFGGYNRYLHGPSIWSKASLIPLELRRIIANAAARVPSGAWDRLLAGIDARNTGDKVHKLANAIARSRTFDEFYNHLVGEWPIRDLVLGQTGRINYHITMPECDNAARMMLADAMRYLPDDILCKVDRAAMSVGLETRAPFLDHRVAETAWHLPMQMRIRDGKGKWALRQILYRHVPKALIERPKTGFAIPIGEWLRGSLRDWAEALLDEHRIRTEGYFRPEPIRAAWTAHLTGRRNLVRGLWPVLMFQMWHDRWLS
ncbi:hypothetical protein ASE00_12675 [Sphingomonas sp. Root710]|nr:hypothetical protein ASE00_12675 [Sphingomonas sp. Root710]